MWPPEAIQFLTDLEDNNDRDWFRANRSRYDEVLVAPARKFVSSLEHLGEAHFFRPYRDTRFRPGPPLKEQFGVAIIPGTGGAYYFELSMDGFLVAAGMHMPATDQLERFRAAIVDGRRAKGFDAAVATAAAKGLALPEPGLKRAPRGYAADHPRLDLLRLKSLTVWKRRPVSDWLSKPSTARTVRAELEATRPLMTWLGDKVGPTTRQRDR